jgi:arylformamidase
MPQWIDATQAIQEGMVHWTGQKTPEVNQVEFMDKGSMVNSTVIHLNVHTGTHMDAPCHFVNATKDISQMPLDAMVGKAKVMEVATGKDITKADIHKAEERIGALEEGGRVLFKTHFSSIDWHLMPFDESYPALTAEAARYLLEKQTILVGIDYLSIAPYNNLVEVHEILLGNEIWIIEGLNLSKAKEGNYEMIAAPLKIKGADGSPCRVLLRPLD